MDSNKHEHTPQSSTIPSIMWLILAVTGVIVTLVIIILGYNLVMSSQKLSEFQAFTVAVLTALIGAVGAVIGKMTYDKMKAEQARMKHEETLETIRSQTNGRLHKRDEQIDRLNRLVERLLHEYEMARNENEQLRKELAKFRASLTNSSEVITEAVESVKNHEAKTFIVENEDTIKDLHEEIKKKAEEISTKYPPFRPKDEQ